MNIYHIDNLDLEELKIYTECNEPQLLHYFEPNGGIFIAETPLVIERALKSGCEPISFLIEERLLKTDAACIISDCTPKYGEVPVFTAPLDVINKLTGYNLMRGMLCAMRRPENRTYEEIVSRSKYIALFENIENPTNLGALFRDAAALGADSAILTKNSTDPLYRRCARVSMGTVFQIPWMKVGPGSGSESGSAPDSAPDSDSVPDSGSIIRRLKDDGFTIISMALTENAIPLDSPALNNIDKSVVVFGNESEGISGETLSLSDHIVMIPMQNGVDSLNVAAAGAVAFWRLFS